MNNQNAKHPLASITHPKERQDKAFEKSMDSGSDNLAPSHSSATN